MANRAFGIMVLAMIALVVYQLFALVAQPRASGPVEYIRLKKASHVASLVTLAGSGDPKTLSEAVKGTCSYVVIYSPTCGASTAAARDWQRGDSVDASMPSGWRAYWINILADSGGRAGLPADFHWKVLDALDGGALQREAAITALPVHILFDRVGAVVGSAVGAPSPTEMRFNEDCTMTRKEHQ